MDRTTYGLDIAKNVMQLHWVNAETGEIGRKKLARARLAEYFAQLRPVRVVMEACGSAHHWARVLGKLGHEVELLPAAQVRPFVRSNKDDAAEARAIWLALAFDSLHSTCSSDLTGRTVARRDANRSRVLCIQAWLRVSLNSRSVADCHPLGGAIVYGRGFGYSCQSLEALMSSKLMALKVLQFHPYQPPRQAFLMTLLSSL